MLSESSNHRIALTVSVVFHLLLLMIPILDSSIELQRPTQEPIAVDFQVKEIIIEKKAPKKPAKKKLRKTTKSVVKSPKKATKKTLQAGDRKVAKISSSAIPNYPKDAINFGHEGRITVLATVDKHGKLLKAEVIESTGHKSLDESFLVSLKESYVFAPKRLYGENQQDRLKITYHFKL